MVCLTSRCSQSAGKGARLWLSFLFADKIFMMAHDIEYLNSSFLIDNELKLTLIEKGITSPPDIQIPVYKFRMTNISSGEEMGGINFRAGYTENIEKFRGNIGFTVFESHRGHYFSAKSCLLLKPFMKFLDFRTIWLTCDRDNVASKKNLEYIGATYIDTTQVEKGSPYAEFYSPHSRMKLRYKWDVR